ncbi:MAG: hypothetical protein QM703_10060 [Gemmatales bacterium]
MVGLLSLLSLAVCTSRVQEPNEVRKFTVTPQAVPSPALRYVLLPPLKDLKTGNAVQDYYRYFAPDTIYLFRLPKFAESMYAWIESPYDQAARKGLTPSQQQQSKKNKDDDEEVTPATREEMSVFRQSQIFDEIDLAARRTYAEWDYLDRMKEQGMGLLLPDVQGIRLIANIVHIRARLAVMDGDYEKALYHLQTGMAMSRHMNQANILICSLTGLSIAKNMLKTVEEFIQTPNAPNLYWALTDLPNPFLDLRLAYAGDRMTIDYLLGDPKQLKERIFTNDEMQKLVEKKLKPLLRTTGGNTSNDFSLLILKEYPRAKVWLQEQGRSPADIEKMTATQAVMIFAHARFQVLADDFAKLFQQPLPERLVHVKAFQQKIKDLGAQGDASFFLGAYFFPHYPTVWITVSQADRDIALLRCVELLRNYAAGHNRQLPAGWEDVKDLPVPIDPITGKRFGYILEGDHAVITAEAIPGSTIPRTERKYEVYLK